ncbi:MAG: alpha-L-fucosidase [bacterium]
MSIRHKQGFILVGILMTSVTMAKGSGDEAQSTSAAVKVVPLSQGKAATCSSLWAAGYAAAKAFDGDDSTRWAAAVKTNSGWIAVDLGAEMEVGGAIIKEFLAPRTERFALEYQQDGQWKEVLNDHAIMGVKKLLFAPVKARHFRLNILDSWDTPTIEEFQLYSPEDAPLVKTAMSRNPKVQWFDEAKFGMFVTWGLYSVLAGEYKGRKCQSPYGEIIQQALLIPQAEYSAIADTWKPERFDADAWVRLAKASGMKYMLLTAKFVDGFLMYPSKVSSFNLYDRSPWKRDPVKELEDACARHGLRFGVYWSQAFDWQDPRGLVPNKEERAKRNVDQYLDEVAIPQFKELLTHYPTLSFIWFDLKPKEMTAERSKRFVDIMHALRPGMIFQSRLGSGDYHDYQSMGDNQIPNTVWTGCWETCGTINETWGYRKDDHNWKSAEELTFKLVDIVSKGGNYILNADPTGEGEMPEATQERILRVGKWLDVNGEAIYGAGRSPFGEEFGFYHHEKKDANGQHKFYVDRDWRCTVKPFDWCWGQTGKLYIHIFEWPKENFQLKGFMGKLKKAFILGDAKRKALETLQKGTELTVTLPRKNKDDRFATVLCLEVE